MLETVPSKSVCGPSLTGRRSRRLEKRSSKHTSMYSIIFRWSPKPCPGLLTARELRWAKSRDSYRRIASENLNHWRSLAVISPPKTQKLVLTDPAFVMLRFRIAGLAFVHLTFVSCGTAEWLARVDRVR